MQLFTADATVILFYFIFAPQNMKKPTSKVAHNGPKWFFFSVLPIGPNPVQISIPVP